MNNKKSVVILAGGLGSRYKALKQIDTILEKESSTILEYSVYDAIRSGFNHFVFVINSLVPKEFVDYLSKILDTQGVEYDWQLQELDSLVSDPSLIGERTKPWGTTHALLCTKEVVKNDFLVINADDFYGRSAYEIAGKLIDENQISEKQYASVTYPLKNTLSKNGFVSRGVCEVEDGYLKSVTERTKIGEKGDIIVFQEDDKETELPTDALVSMNYWVFNPSIFTELEVMFDTFVKGNPGLKEEIYIPKSIDELIQNGKIKVLVKASMDDWKGITYPEDKEELQQFLNEKIDKGLYPRKLWS